MLGETAGDITVTDGISVAGATLKHCETVEADVVVMGTRGHTGLKHVLLGSVAETIARYKRSPRHRREVGLGASRTSRTRRMRSSRVKRFLEESDALLDEPVMHESIVGMP